MTEDRHDLLLPRLTETMDEGVVGEWMVADGAEVRKGEVVALIETDKASFDFESPADGVLQILVGPGEAAPVESAIGRLLGTAEERTTPAAAEAAVGEARASRRLRASPVARRMAEEHRIDLATAVGTGPNGRIVREDVERLLADRVPSVASGQPVAPRDESPRGESTRLAPTRMRKIVAERMEEAKRTIPEFALSIEVDLENALVLRSRLKAEIEQPPSVNDLVVKAVALALRDHPMANAAWSGEGVVTHSRVNIGIAVAADAGLLVPTVFDADRKSASEIGAESRRLAARARDGSISPAELEGGTFTVSNLGMFGVSRFIPIVNPGQAAILGVGAVQPRFVPDEEGAAVLRRWCELTLVSDHRVLYGADAARFSARLADLLARPLSLLAA